MQHCRGDLVYEIDPCLLLSVIFCHSSSGTIAEQFTEPVTSFTWQLCGNISVQPQVQCKCATPQGHTALGQRAMGEPNTSTD